MDRPVAVGDLGQLRIQLPGDSCWRSTSIVVAAAAKSRALAR
ncbi:hypothetical protein JOD67_006962 [Tenggerimyces flavus]|nr:hypothetical protein [Tenggerimyces flavus]